MINSQVLSGHLTPYDYESVDVGAVAVGLTATKLRPTASLAARDLGYARLVVITIEGGPIRFTTHGTNPTAADVGHLTEAGSVLDFSNLQTLTQFRAIKADVADAKLKVTYYR